MEPVLRISGLEKIYGSGHRALVGVDLTVNKGEIFALLGPNGAGKTTLINIVCGIVTPTAGTVLVNGADHKKEAKRARASIGLVPQELHTDAFEAVIATVRFSRGLFGKKRDDAFIEKLLTDLSLWDKRNDKIMTLSGGMKRRVLIAKALSHEPELLFLDEPSAGVDVELRRGMWAMVRALRDRGVTIILTTHYIQEAQDMADRVGVISKGQLIVVDETATLMKKLGKKTLTLSLAAPLLRVPAGLEQWPLELHDDGNELVYKFDTSGDASIIGVPALLRRLGEVGVNFKDLATHESSLEEIFVTLLQGERRTA